ncbi:MAG: hypothetical protein ACE5D6_05910 [Candidatus Zixiibacteriota bacterium]
MRKILLILLIILLVMPFSVTFAQFKAFGVVGAGSMYTEQGATYSHFIGANIPIVSQPGYKNYTRTTYFYVNQEIQEAQGIIVWDMNQKSLGLFPETDWYVALGIGGSYNIEAGEDIIDLALKLETGLNIKGNFGFAIGGDYIPVKEGYDNKFVYLLLDFFP